MLYYLTDPKVVLNVKIKTESLIIVDMRLYLEMLM